MVDYLIFCLIRFIRTLYKIIILNSTGPMKSGLEMAMLMLEPVDDDVPFECVDGAEAWGRFKSGSDIASWSVFFREGESKLMMARGVSLKF